VNLPDLYTIANEILKASVGEGTFFDENDVRDMATPGLRGDYGLGWWVGSRGGLECDPEDILLHMMGAGGRSTVRSLTLGDADRSVTVAGQLVTIVPKKRLIVIRSGFFFLTDLDMYYGFWDRLFSGVSCSC